jgi:hypothetical protein
MAVSTAHTSAQLNALGFSYPMIPGSPNGGSINNTYGVSQYPTTIIIAPNRAIVNQDIWPISNTILRNAITTAGGVPTTCPSTSIDEDQALGFNVFPNPVDDVLYFSTEQNATIQLFDITGRMLETFNASSNSSFNCAHLAPGMYTVRAFNDDGQLISVKKILKK